MVSGPVASSLQLDRFRGGPSVGRAEEQGGGTGVKGGKQGGYACLLFLTSKGCKKGINCLFRHNNPVTEEERLELLRRANVQGLCPFKALLKPIVSKDSPPPPSTVGALPVKSDTSLHDEKTAANSQSNALPCRDTGSRDTGSRDTGSRDMGSRDAGTDADCVPVTEAGKEEKGKGRPGRLDQKVFRGKILLD